MKNDPNEKPNRAGGTALGILLAIAWIVFLWFVERSFFPHLGGIQNPVIEWLYIGPMVFFVVFGNYLLYYRKLGGVEAVHATVELKSSFLSILIWFPVTVILFFMQWDGPWHLSSMGGLLTMLVVYLLWKRSAVRKDPLAIAEQE